MIIRLNCFCVNINTTKVVTIERLLIILYGEFKMNLHALYHKSDSLYSYAVSPDTVKLQLRAARGDLTAVSVVYGCKYDFRIKRKSAPLTLCKTNNLFDYFSVELKLEDKRLAYIFKITDKTGKTYYFSEDGATDTYNFELGYYNFFQLAYINECDIVKQVDWLSNAVIYQIFVDRFNRGDFTKDDSYVNLKWGQVPKPNSIAGGDLEGIRQKIDYLKSLGVNTVYLTPIFKSASNHKYDIYDYYNVDDMFGGNEAFSKLMADCKAKGMRVILDAVFNHCSEKFDKFQDVVKHGKNSPYFDWFIINGDKVRKNPMNYECFGSCDYMPKLNTSNEEVQKYFCEVGKYYITKYGIDGWRLDVSDEVSHVFWRNFRKAVKQVSPDAALIGENWHDSRSYLVGDQFDSIMNYAFTKAALDFYSFGKFNAASMSDKLNEILSRNTDPVNNMQMNLLDCHDTHRFFSQVNLSETKLVSAVALNVFFAGATMIYYGTEIATVGGYDPDCRRCFDWDKQTPVKDKVAKLLQLKTSHDALKGDIKITAQGDLLVIERKNNKNSLTLYINSSSDNTVVKGKSIPQFGYLVCEGDKIIIDGGDNEKV